MKRISILVASVVVAFTAAGCGSSTSFGANTAVQAPVNVSQDTAIQNCYAKISGYFNAQVIPSMTYAYKTTSKDGTPVWVVRGGMTSNPAAPTLGWTCGEQTDGSVFGVTDSIGQYHNYGKAP